MQHAECPLCKTSVEVDESQFGALTSCAKCGGVFFLGWDGKPESAPAAEPEIESNVQNEEPRYEPSTFEPISESVSIEPQFQESGSYHQENVNEVSYESSLQGTTEDQNQYVSPSENQESASEYSNYDVDQPLDSYQNNSYSGAASENQDQQKENFNDLVDFGNSNASGIINYKLKIEGIDLPSTEQEIKDILSETRFQFDVESIFANIESGILVIDNLSPVKASVLVHRLRFLPVTLSWRQNEIG